METYQEGEVSYREEIGKKSHSNKNLIKRGKRTGEQKRIGNWSYADRNLLMRGNYSGGERNDLILIKRTAGGIALVGTTNNRSNNPTLMRKYSGGELILWKKNKEK